jgi:hypothetical protein
MLQGAVDGHVHACPHLNPRSLDVFQAVRAAADAGMSGLGLMDNFCNSGGYAALAMRELGDLGVDVFGGLIMEPPAGGLSTAAVRTALGYGYGHATGARFISLPTHHTRYVARQERRSALHIEACLEIPEQGPLPDPLPEILDIVAAADVVLNTGHIAGIEAVRLVEMARARGVSRILVPCNHHAMEEVRAVTAQGAYAEFSFFFLSHATQVGLTHVDAERHTIAGLSVARLALLIEAATPAQTILSSDCGVGILPPPTEGLRELILLVESLGYDQGALRCMTAKNPAALFKVRPPSAAP